MRRNYRPTIEQDDELIEGLTDDQKELILKDALYRAGMKGDTAAARTWVDMNSGKANEDAFRFSVNVVPYSVKDTSLRSIIKECEPSTLLDMMYGVRERMEIDEFSHDLRQDYVAWLERFRRHVERMYAPKDA